MHLLYLVSARRNPLYGGKFLLNGRYRTYGQHSFLYDFAAACHRGGHQMDIFVDDLQEFPIALPLTAYCRIHNASEIADVRHEWSVALLDLADSQLLSILPAYLRTICIVHNPYQIIPVETLDRCDLLMCLSEYAFEEKIKIIQRAKLALNPQGIDLGRFTVSHVAEARRGRTRVLVYSRLDAEKRDAVQQTIRALAQLDVDLTVLGDGEEFWSISDDLGRDVTLINFIPCHCIHRILGNYDLVVSSGRGVMEAMACGKPVICAGRSYGGPVLEENIERLRRVNFTKSDGSNSDIGNLRAHIEAALSLRPETCRRLAERLFDVESFVRGVSALI
jgi:glycosyltransferase involved in cell wall biosynthesis